MELGLISRIIWLFCAHGARVAQSVTRLRTGQPVSDLRQGQEFFFSSSHPDRFWGPPNLMSSVDCSSGIKAAET
jgi:hypothetical protein